MDFFNRLQFIPDKKRYKVYLHVALIRIATEDVELALARPDIAIVGLVRGTQPLGAWVRALWDPRRYRPPHGETFLQILVA